MRDPAVSSTPLGPAPHVGTQVETGTIEVIRVPASSPGGVILLYRRSPQAAGTMHAPHRAARTGAMHDNAGFVEGGKARRPRRLDLASGHDERAAQLHQGPRRQASLDPAELERVFGIKGITTFRGNDADPDRKAPQAETIRHLRRLLEIEVAERRRMLALLTGPRAPWWRRLFR